MCDCYWNIHQKRVPIVKWIIIDSLNLYPIWIFHHNSSFTSKIKYVGNTQCALITYSSISKRKWFKACALGCKRNKKKAPSMTATHFVGTISLILNFKFISQQMVSENASITVVFVDCSRFRFLERICYASGRFPSFSCQFRQPLKSHLVRIWKKLIMIFSNNLRHLTSH